MESFLRALKTELRLGAHLDDVLQEVADVVGVMEEVDAELSPELLELRRELVALRPEADDSDVAAPTDAGPRRTTALATSHGTLAFFDEHARADPMPFNADGEGGRAKTLLSILQRKDLGFLREVKAAAGEGVDSAADTVGPAEASAGDRPTMTRTSLHRTRSTGGAGGLGTSSAATTTPFGR